jgi:hypothetical protein
MQVLVELVALVGWLANSSDDTAQLVGSESDIPRVLADHLAARLPALQVPAHMYSKNIYIYI